MDRMCHEHEHPKRGEIADDFDRFTDVKDFDVELRELYIVCVDDITYQDLDKLRQKYKIYDLTVNDKTIEITVEPISPLND